MRRKKKPRKQSFNFNIVIKLTSLSPAESVVLYNKQYVVQLPELDTPWVLLYCKTNLKVHCFRIVQGDVEKIYKKHDSYSTE